MRTTIDLPEDLHRQAKAIARDTERTFSETVVDLVRRGLERDVDASVVVSERTGLPLVSIGRVITSEDVRALDDDA
jgi:predicted transcriptional regulator